jgi:hypothetical protein
LGLSAAADVSREVISHVKQYIEKPYAMEEANDMHESNVKHMVKCIEDGEFR